MQLLVARHGRQQRVRAPELVRPLGADPSAVAPVSAGMPPPHRHQQSVRPASASPISVAVVCDFPILGGPGRPRPQLLDGALTGCAPKQVDRNDFTRCRNLLSTRQKLVTALGVGFSICSPAS